MPLSSPFCVKARADLLQSISAGLAAFGFATGQNSSSGSPCGQAAHGNCQRARDDGGNPPSCYENPSRSGSLRLRFARAKSQISSRKSCITLSLSLRGIVAQVRQPN